MGESIQVRLLRLAKPTQVLDNPAEGRPDGHHRQAPRRVRTDPRLPPDPRGAGPRRRRGLSLGMVRDHGGSGSRCPSTPGTGQDGSCRRQTFRAGPTGCARDVTATAPGMKRVGDITHIPTWQGSAHPAVVVDCSPGKSRRARDRRSHAHRTRRRGLGHGRAGPVRRSVVSRSSTRIEELNTRRPNTRNS